jgi:hypothetical protein
LDVNGVTSPWRQFRRRYFKPWWRVPYGDLKVHYKRHLDGGGNAQGQEYLPFLVDRGAPQFERVFEWCAGPGFIGFSLLAHGFCKTLCLADINKEAVLACRRTVGYNRLGDRVTVYHSDNLKAIPASEQWDLIVSNPPHFPVDRITDIRLHDPNFRLHRDFFNDVGKFLKPSGVIVLQENNLGSTAETFREMVDAAGLRIIFAQGDGGKLTPYPRYYYLGIVHRGAQVPAWATATPSPYSALAAAG